MRLIGFDKQEDCFDGSAVYLGRFAESWSEPEIRALASLGDLDYFPDFPRPFFRLRGEGGFEIRGVQGEPVCRVVLPRTNRDAIRARLTTPFTEHSSIPDKCAR